METGKKGYRFCEIGLMLYNLSEHQIEALSNLLRGNDCFISQPTGSGKSAVYISLYFLSLLYEAFQLLRSNDVYVEPKTQEIVISNM
jgi:replicative superfamily II helicase